MTIFSRLFKMFLLVVFVPLIPVSMLVFYYQGYAKNNILETHDNLAKMASSFMAQHIDDMAWRLSFAEGMEKNLNDKNGTLQKLEDALAANPDFLMLAVLDENGREIYKAGPKYITGPMGVLDLSKDESLDYIRKQNRLNVSSFDTKLGLPIAEFIYPLKNGKFIFGVVSFYKLWNRIETTRIGNTGRLYLIAKNGNIFMSDYGEGQIISSYRLNSAILSGGKLQKSLKGADGTAYIGAIEPSPVGDAFVAVFQQKQEAFKSINAITAFLLFFIIAIALLSYFAAYSFAGSIADPIAALTAGAKRVAKGKFDTPVERDSAWAELNTLIDSFNDMTLAVKDYRDLQLKQQVSEVKEFIFKAVAHDLRAPVLGLQGYVELLQSGKFTREQEQEYIATMKDALANLSVLLENILDASKLEAGMLKPVRKNFSARTFTRKNIDIIKPAAAQKNIELRAEIKSSKPVFGDEKLLTRVLSNLLSNSLKFTDAGFIAVTYDHDGKNAVFSVEDTGPGIEEKEMDAVFEKYHKTDASKGYGLGLAIAKQIVAAHGGAIKARRPKSGKGALIIFTIPGSV